MRVQQPADSAPIETSCTLRLAPLPNTPESSRDDLGDLMLTAATFFGLW